MTRRQMLRTGGIWLGTFAVGVDLACDRASAPSSTASLSRAPAPIDTFAPYGYAAPSAASVVPSGCFATEANIEGPYYRAGAPSRDDLTEAGMPGSRLIVSGRVLDLDCAAPLEGATLDVWQADSEGHYDNDHRSRETDGTGPLRLRGKLVTGTGGAFRFRTVVPGRYLNGRVYRPAHVHVKVSAPGHVPLTTQLYFEGDPYNDVDPFLRKTLIMRLSSEGTEKRAHFDFVLAGA